MPIFMDRHDVWETTAADVAEAHRKDLEVQDRYGVKFLTYWFDQSRGTIFCLVDAPDKEAAQCVHREAHGGAAGESSRSRSPRSKPSSAASTTRRRRPAKAHSQIDAGHRAILFTDIVGSTEMTARLGDRMATELIRAHDSIVRRCLAACEGREVKHTGDGIMAAFPDGRRGVDCAIRIQREFRHYNQHSQEPIHVRIGLDSGEPVADSNDLFGATVQLAARLCSEAAADQILVSETVRTEHGDAALFKAAEQRQLKGFAGTVGVVECVWV